MVVNREKDSYDFLLWKFATRHCYFLTFAKTQCSILPLPTTTTILCHVCQNTLHCPKKREFHIFLGRTTLWSALNNFSILGHTVFWQRYNWAVCFGKRQKIMVSCSKLFLFFFLKIFYLPPRRCRELIFFYVFLSSSRIGEESLLIWSIGAYNFAKAD
jgi:hypothetical protein